jgi:hypothetical protein
MPEDIIHAYEKRTRSISGKPGPAYWQNTVDYDLEVTILPEENKLKGSGSAVYFNNSPDDLNKLVVRLYNHIYHTAKSRPLNTGQAENKKSSFLKYIKINGKRYHLDDPRDITWSGTYMIVHLRNPLRSGKQLTMTTAWEKHMPLSKISAGTYDSTSFFIANWYPQISVYDDIFGWDRSDNKSQTEYYNNLGNYRVKITAPKNYTVWATGSLENPDEVLPEKIFKRLQKAKTSSELVHIITEEDLKSKHSDQSAIWHYRADDVSDFAFGFSDHFLWDAAACKLKDRYVLINTVFPPTDSGAISSILEAQQKVMHYFSNYVPGIPYPYPALTTMFNRGAVESDYPMMSNQGMIVGVDKTIHKMFLNYFPMYIRINEKRYNFFDEGFADYIEVMACRRICKNNYKPPFENYNFRLPNYIASYFEMPMVLSSQFLSNGSKNHTQCWLPGFVFEMLHQHLEETLFQRCLKQYMIDWANKSPTPYDLMYTFERVSSQDLSWLWEPWFFQFGNMDVVIESFDNGTLEIANRGSRPVPIHLLLNYNNGTSRKMKFGPSIWKHSKLFNIEVPDHTNIRDLSINRDIEDDYHEDNFYPINETYHANPGMLIRKDFTGEYLMKEEPCTIKIARINDLLLFSYPDFKQNTFLMPKTETEFESQGGSIKVQFILEDNICTGLKLEDLWGHWTASKQ